MTFKNDLPNPEKEAESRAATWAGLINPLGNAVKNSFALAGAGGGAQDFVPMLVDHVSKANNVRLRADDN